MGLAVVADEGAGDVGDAVEEEDGGGGVRGEAPAGGVGVAEAAVGVGGAVGIALGHGANAKTGRVRGRQGRTTGVGHGEGGRVNVRLGGADVFEGIRAALTA